MSNEIDTARIRRTARQIRSIAAAVGEIAADNLGALQKGVEGNFEGEAAQALREKLDELRGDVEGVRGGLNAVCRELLAYAARLDEADREAARMIESK